MKFLVLGAGPFQVELIKQAQKHEEVFVVSNKTDDPGATLADYFFQVSILDFEGCLKIVQEFKIDFVLSAGSQLASFTESKLVDDCGLEGFPHAFVSVMTDKLLLRDWLTKHGFSNLAYTSRGEELSKEKHWLIKPRIASGSRGIVRFEQQLDLELIAQQSFIVEGWLAEEELKGKHMTALFAVAQGEIHLLMATEKVLNEHFVPIAHRLSELSVQQKDYLTQVVQTMVRGFKLKSGFLDFDFIICDNRIEIVDVGTRLSGNGLVDLYEQATGVNLYAQQVLMKIGEKISAFPQLRSEPLGVMLYFSVKKGRLQAYQNNYHQLNVLKSSQLVKERSTVHELTEGKYQLGFFIFEAEDKIAVQKALEKGTIILD